jgi:hypothetical protein
MMTGLAHLDVEQRDQLCLVRIHGDQVLFVLGQRLHTRRQSLKVVVPEDAPIRDVLELTGMPRVIPVESRLDEAPAD